MGIKSKTLKTFVVVIVIAEFKKTYLLLKRNSNRRYFPNKWQPVSGFLKEYESVEKAALRELNEETSLSGEIVRYGKVFTTKSQNEKWIIIPLLVKVTNNQVKIDTKEHTQYIWIKEKKDLDNLELVKGVDKDFKYLDIFKHFFQ